MKKAIYLILILMVNVSFGQNEKPENKTVTESFIKHYNAEKFDEIFSIFSPEMKKALPLDKAKGFLAGLNTQVGKIKEYEFVKYKNGSYASYKTEFARATLAVNISIDAESRINGLFVQPFVDEQKLKEATNNLKLDNLSESEAKIIYENTKLFPQETQLALALIKNGEVSFVGVKNDNYKLSTIENSSSIFEIGSVSKVLTSTLLAGFVVDKKLSLDDVVNRFFSFPLKSDAKITLQQLANHTSGLPRLPTNLDLNTADPSNPYKDYKAKDLDDYLKNELTILENTYAYSNLGAGLLGYLLSIHSNSSFEDLLQNKIFKKYQMINSTSMIAKVKNKLVKGIDKDGKQTSNWDLSVLAGAGGVLSNVEDMTKFVMAQFETSNKELALSRQKTFEISDQMEIGLGWHILKGRSENDWFWHNGSTGGYKSSVVLETKNENAVIILSNVSAFNPNSDNIDKLGSELLKSIEAND